MSTEPVSVEGEPATAVPETLIVEKAPAVTVPAVAGVLSVLVIVVSGVTAADEALVGAPTLPSRLLAFAPVIAIELTLDFVE